MVGGYLIAYAVLLITGARLGQTHGYRRIFLFGLAGFGGASLVRARPRPGHARIARVFRGAGAALMYPQALTGIQLNFVGPARARAIGSLALALAGGAVAGQIFGGVLISADLAQQRLAGDLPRQLADRRSRGGRRPALPARRE